jgi:predicted nucleotidyltransferase
MLSEIASRHRYRITVIHADQTQSVEEVIKPQSVVDEIVENYYEDGAFTVTVEQINDDAGVPDNKGFGRHG